MNNKFNTVEEALEALRRGEIIIVSDDENRENEGDFICSCEAASTENINFMAINGKGLICMPMKAEIAETLNLTYMVEKNTDNHCTAFTVSIDHIDTTTGISAAERSVTAMKCIDENSKPDDFRRPGHMFPLIAKRMGVLERDGHTEATVDLMKLAGLKECGICCEIMGEDGHMMRQDEIFEKNKEWKLKYITIKDLIKYRRKHERLIERAACADLPTKYGRFKAYGYLDLVTGEHHVALVKGDVENRENTLVRVHSECLTGDTFGSMKCDCGDQLATAMKRINEEGNGVLIYMRQEGRGIGLINKLKAYELQEKGMDTLDANLALGFEGDLRKYHISAQILKDLGCKSIRIMTNNTDKVEQLEEYGISIIERVALEIEANEFDIFYLKTKKERMNHLLSV